MDSLVWIRRLHVSHVVPFILSSSHVSAGFFLLLFSLPISFPIIFPKLLACIQTVFSQRFRHICVWKATIKWICLPGISKSYLGRTDPKEGEGGAHSFSQWQ